MKTILFSLLLLSTLALAADKRMAMIQGGVVQNIADWDGVKTWIPSGYTLVDVTSMTQVQIGWTCSKCDGSDFQAPSGG